MHPIKGRTYIDIALSFMILGIVLWVMQVIRIPGDNVIVRQPDTTLHDMIYFQSMYGIQLVGLIVVVNLCFFIKVNIGEIAIVKWFIYLSYIVGAVIFTRCIGNTITYYQPSIVELAIDGILTLIITLIYFKCYFYRQNRI